MKGRSIDDLRAGDGAARAGRHAPQGAVQEGAARPWSSRAALEPAPGVRAAGASRHERARRFRKAPAAILALLLTACGSASATSARDDQRIVVLAASSLQPAFRELAAAAREEGLSVTFSFAGSGRLAAQVREGVPADVVATADTDTLGGLARSGLLSEPPVVFATNALAIAVARGNPRRVQGLADLAQPGLDVVLAAPAVPAGRYAAQVLSSAGVEVKPISLEDNVAAVAARVARREADAGVVYATDTRGRPELEKVAIPAGQNITARYPIAVLTSSARPAAARRFLRLVTSPQGRRILARAGFGAP